MATIRQRGNFWEVQIRRTGWPSLSRSFSFKADARAWAAIIESEIERGVFIDRSEAKKNTLGDLLRRYVDEVTPHKKSTVAERYKVHPFQGL